MFQVFNMEDKIRYDRICQKGVSVHTPPPPYTHTFGLQTNFSRVNWKNLGHFQGILFKFLSYIGIDWQEMEDISKKTPFFFKKNHH